MGGCVQVGRGVEVAVGKGGCVKVAAGVDVFIGVGGTGVFVAGGWVGWGGVDVGGFGTLVVAMSVRVGTITVPMGSVG